MIIGQLKLFGRAEHALTLDTAQLANLDDERLAIIAGRQLCSNQRARNSNTHTGIGRAAHDVQQLGLAYIDLAYAQSIGIGVLYRFLDFTNNDFGEWWRHGLQFFNLQAGHGERFSQLRGGNRWVAKGAQPGFRKLHDESWVFLLELRQKANIAVKEQTQIVYPVAQHR